MKAGSVAAPGAPDPARPSAPGAAGASARAPAPVDPFQEEEILGKAYDARLLMRLWPYVRPYGWQVGLTLLLVAPMAALELAPGWIIKTGLDHVFPAEGASPRGPLSFLFEPPYGVSALAWLGTLYLAVMIGFAGLQIVNMFVMAWTGQSAMRDLRRDVFGHIQKLHLGFFDTYPVGRLVTRATNDVENVAEMFSAGIIALIGDLLRMLVIAAALFVVSPKLAAVNFIVVPVLAVIAVVFRLKVREAYRAVRVRIARINTHIQETITGMKVVQLFARERRNLRHFDAMNASHRDAWYEAIRWDAALFSSVEVANGLAFAVIIGYGATGEIGVGVMFAFIDWIRRFFMPLRDLSAKYATMQSSMAGLERIFHLLDTEPAIRDRPDARVPAPRSARGEVEFQNVWFAYAGEEWVLRDVSFRVAPGERAAFVGATGAGKTTVIKLLTRFYEPTRGRILLDGVDLRELTQQDLRRRVAMVLQDVFLFSGSVRENIGLGRSDISDDSIRRAARAVEAHAFIERLPQGYDTELRERGGDLSAGQRQLLSFARALVHGADVLVLDEATSSIDTDTEGLLQRGIHVLMQNKTALVIAHRLSTIQDVDRIYALRHGRIVESGSHTELLARRGLYWRLYRLQYASQERGSVPEEREAV